MSQIKACFSSAMSAGILCANADPANGGMMGCLKKHEKELSPPCVERLKSMGSGKE